MISVHGRSVRYNRHGTVCRSYSDGIRGPSTKPTDSAHDSRVGDGTSVGILGRTIFLFEYGLTLDSTADVVSGAYGKFAPLLY